MSRQSIAGDEGKKMSVQQTEFIEEIYMLFED